MCATQTPSSSGPSSRKLLDSLFRQAVYRVFEPSGPLRLQLDTAEPALAALLVRHGANHAALVTAWNPAARLQPRAANLQRQQQLKRWLREHAYVWLDAEGAAADRSWVEPSVLVLGLRPDAAADLASRFDQLAWIELDASGRATLRYATCFEDNPPPCRSS